MNLRCSVFKPIVRQHSKVPEVNYTIPAGWGDIRRWEAGVLEPLIAENSKVLEIYIAVTVKIVWRAPN